MRSKQDNYNTCLTQATERYNNGSLKLCPRGYCTAKEKFTAIKN